MAQWKHSPFDWVWDRKYAVALRALCRAADRCAAHDASALAPNQLAAVVLRIFASEWTEHELRRDRAEQSRPLDDWLRITSSLDIEIRNFLPTAALDNANGVASALCHILEYAEAGWSAGNPEDPPCEQVLNWLLAIFHQHGGNVHAPNPRFPRSPWPAG